ncbi:MAG: hypothetical protein DRH44_02085 [Candidatus Coatesbacteria bacterium]|nr:MAG: hypothetical protein DRH44_02085 [Candidatus Coatesbacteria bacterium]
MGITERLANIDRRIIFLFIAIAVIIPLLHPIGLPTKVSPPVEKAYQAMEGLPDGSYILISADYDPATMPEIQPMMYSLLHHAFKKHHKVIVMALWPQGASLAEEALNEVAPLYDAKYSVDYVNLGFKSGGGIVILAIGSDFSEPFPKDMYGDPTSEMDIMSNIENLNDIDLVIDLSAGDPGIPAWVMIANARFHRKIVGGCTAVSAPQFYPYLDSGQMVGLLGGMRGAADYETRLNILGTATAGMDAQSIAHIVIIIFIIIANIFFFVEKRKKG